MKPFCAGIARTAVALLVATGAACGDQWPSEPVALSKAAGASLVYVEGNLQTGEPGAVLPVPTAVRTADNRGRSLPGVPVEFIVTSGGGSVTSSLVQSDSAGIARTDWMLGVPGSQTLEARLSGTYTKGWSAAVITFSATALDSGATPEGRVVIAVPTDSILQVGQTLSLEATAHAADGSLIEDAAIEWQSLNPDIATVDTMGTFLARAAGVVLVTAGAAGCADDTARLIVEPPDGSATPAEVTDLAVSDVTPNSVTLRWTAVSDGAGAGAKYAIRYGSPTLIWSEAYATERTIEARAVGEQLTFEYPDLQAATEYEFRVVSYRGTLNQDAVFGAPSNAVSATTGDDASAPSPISVSAQAVPGDAQVTLSAPTPSGGTPPYSYQWHGGTTDPGASPSSATALSGLTTLDASHTGLTNGTTYYYRLVVRDASGATGVSSVVNATPSSATTGSAQRLMHEDWSQGISQGRWESGYDPQNHSVVTDPTGSGRGAVLRVEHRDDGGAGYLAHWPYGSGEVNPTGELFIRAWIFVPASFDASDYAKMLIIKGNRTDNLYSSFGQAGVRSNGTNFFESYMAYAAPGRSDRGLHFYTYHVDMPGIYGDVDYTRGAALADREPAPGAWHKFEFWLRQNTVGQADGAQRIWVDDTLVLEWTGLRFRTSEILQANAAVLTFTSAENTGQIWYVDDVDVYDRVPAGMVGWP